MVRIARELHIPIADALELPASEIIRWRLVYEEEYYEAHPDKRPRTRYNTADSMRDLFKTRSKIRSNNG